jgi:hypothetical protein
MEEACVYKNNLEAWPEIEVPYIHTNDERSIHYKHLGNIEALYHSISEM